MYVLCPYLVCIYLSFCISINVISDQQKIFNYHNLIIMFFFVFMALIYQETVFFLIMFFFSNGFYNFFTIYDLCAVIIIINLLSIYIIKNQRLTNISHKVVVNAESLLYVISNKKYSIIIVSLIWYIHFYFLRFVFVCAVVRITNQTNIDGKVLPHLPQLHH